MPYIEVQTIQWQILKEQKDKVWPTKQYMMELMFEQHEPT